MLTARCKPLVAIGKSVAESDPEESSIQYVPRILFEIELEYTRSRGPGGQHVNRSNTAALLRWNVDSSQGFSPEDKERIKSVLKNVISQDGELFLRSEEFRDQDSNRKKCLEKLDALIARALFVPKKRKATRPTKSSKIQRRKAKKVRSEIKAGRARVRHSSDSD